MPTSQSSSGTASGAAGAQTSSAGGSDERASGAGYMPVVLTSHCHEVRPYVPIVASGGEVAALQAEPAETREQRAELAIPRWKNALLHGSPPAAEGAEPAAPADDWKPFIPTEWPPGTDLRSWRPAGVPDAPALFSGGVSQPRDALEDALVELQDIKLQARDLVARSYAAPLPDLEARDRYENLLEALEAPKHARRLAAALVAHRSDAMVEAMGAATFVSYLSQSEHNLGSTLEPVWSDAERAAVYGFSLRDGAIIDRALREGQGSLSDAGLAQYAEHVASALEKLPDHRAGGPLLMLEPEAKPLVTGDHFTTEAFTRFGPYDPAAPPAPGSGARVVEDARQVKDIGPFSAQPGAPQLVALPGAEYVVTRVEDAWTFVLPTGETRATLA